jgi:hypothetical protein
MTVSLHSLPDDVLLSILSLLSIASILRLRQVRLILPPGLVLAQ